MKTKIEKNWKIKKERKAKIRNNQQQQTITKETITKTTTNNNKQQPQTMTATTITKTKINNNRIQR